MLVRYDTASNAMKSWYVASLTMSRTSCDWEVLLRSLHRIILDYVSFICESYDPAIGQ